MFYLFKALTDKQKADISPVDKDCQEKSKISKKLVDDLFNHSVSNISEYKNNKALRKYLVCVDTTGGWLNQDGTYDTQASIKWLKDGGLSVKKALEAIRKCGVVKETLEDTSFNAFMCLYEIGL